MKKVALISMIVVLFVAAFAVTGCAKKDAGTIKIGTILPISGPVSAYGIQTRDAINLAFEEINADGGVLGKKLELIAEDDEASPEKSANAFKKLTSSDKVNVIIGALTSKCSLAITSLSQAKKVVQISTSSTNDTVTDAGDFIFRACYNDSFQGQVVAKYAIETLKGKTAAILYDISNDYSVGLTENFKSKFEELGGKLVAVESYNSGDKDFNAQLTKIKSTKPDVLLLPDYYNTVSLIAKQVRAQGITIPLLGADGWDEITNNAGDEALNGFYSNHYSPDSDDPAVKKFVAAYKAKYNQDPNALAALGYDTAYLVAAAIKNAGTAADSQKIRDAMAALDMQLVTGRIKFNEKRNPVKSAVIVEVVKGADGKLTTKYAATVNP
jgi:branched-chain amino acid transport system substrate-binding protein